MAFGHSKRIAAIVAALACACVLSSCGSPGQEQPSQVARYVALGDSEVAGPGIATAVGACQRSNHNYPSLVAAKFKVRTFIDNSCSGATTGEVLKGRQAGDGSFRGPQIEAVTKDTDVVTVGIGANDGAFFSSQLLCAISGAIDSKHCRKTRQTMPAELSAIKTGVTAVLRTVKERAPHALVVLVGYLRLIPTSGHCAAVAVPSTRLNEASATEHKLADVLKAAAKDAEVRYLPMYEKSAGHDACADKSKSWVNGVTPDSGDGVAMHPRSIGMKKIAAALEPIVAPKLKVKD